MSLCLLAVSACCVCVNYVCLISSILIIFFFIQYWLDKYNMFRRFSSPTDFSFQFVEIILSTFEMTLLFFSISHFFWDLSIHYDAIFGYKFLNIAEILLSAAYIGIFLFTTERFRNKILFFRSKSDIFSYTDYMEFQTNKFAKTFFTENPATSCFSGLENADNYARRDSYQPKYQKRSQQIEERYAEVAKRRGKANPLEE